MQVTLGGERLGGGKKNKVTLRNFERSTFNHNKIWRSTMASGTLVPFIDKLALPGDSFDIDLACEVLTHPTIGPLFGHYTVYLDVFTFPYRLAQGKLHMNLLDIGRDMSQVKLPQYEMVCDNPDVTKGLDNQAVNPSALLAYLGVRGNGYNPVTAGSKQTKRQFNAVPLIAYGTIYKNYYANKQEEIGVLIHRDVTLTPPVATAATFTFCNPEIPIIPVVPTDPIVYTYTTLVEESLLSVQGVDITEDFNIHDIWIWWKGSVSGEGISKASDWFDDYIIDVANQQILLTKVKPELQANWGIGNVSIVTDAITGNTDDTEPILMQFPLENIDRVNKDILKDVDNVGHFIIDKNTIAPYGQMFQEGVPDGVTGRRVYSKQYGQEGLFVRTYKSDLFNNWLNTEWIEGAGGVNEITAIDVSDGTLKLNELIMSRKIFDMLNGIAVAGGTYDVWVETVYGVEMFKNPDSPVYHGGLIRDVEFQEVVSNSETFGAPLGTLAGRGRMGNKHKGGSVKIKITELSHIIGIVSIVPNIDYSQGNEFHTGLKTMNDPHKPHLDQIGFMDLPTDWMAWFDTQCDELGNVTYKSAGKIPAWSQYMTDINKVYGNFADHTQQMFMVLNRRYETKGLVTDFGIKDLTTYIDPSKFNFIFADTRLDAQNFWVQIATNMTVRRKMSSKVMPNL